MLKSNNNYNNLTTAVSPKSKYIKNSICAFLIGGTICMIGQLLITLYEYWGVNSIDSPLIASISLIFLSALLTSLNVYDSIAKHGGAGTLVPITGFSNAVVAPALEFKSEGLITGLGAKMFIIAGPVIAYGTIASVIYGLILYIFKLY